jgi:2-dehydro-3-deoxy-D-pentonate aldolase
MKDRKHSGAVVPVVTPVTAAGELDLAGVHRLTDSVLAARVSGIFVLGTTGEGASVPRSQRALLVRHTVARVRGRALVYAGIGDTCLADSVAAANDYFQSGVDAVVALPPVYFPLSPSELLAYFKALLDRVAGPVILYNIPSTTRVSIPLDVVAQLQGHPRLVGLKDSENDAARHEALIKRFGRDSTLSIFVGVGALMASGLRQGAHGIVPSVGNLVPDTCQQFCEAAERGEWAAAEQMAARMSSVAALYQNGRTLGQSLAALKAALHLRGVCGPDMLPPLLSVAETELETLRSGMRQLKLLN